MTGMLRAIAASIASFGERVAQSREIDAMSREELAAIAHDLSLSPDDIRTAVRRGPGVGVEAEAMMAAFGLDPADPRLASFSTREAARTCLNCEGRERCHAELEAGTARLNAAAFCPNAETFECLARPQG